MPGSLPDVILNANEWTSLHAKAGLPSGTALSFRNKTGGDLLVFESATKPDANSRDGDLLEHKHRGQVGAGSPGCWVLSTVNSGRVFVQAGA